MIGRPVDELCVPGGPLAPLKPRWVKSQLSATEGQFAGIGMQVGRKWLLDDDDIAAIKQRLRRHSPTPRPSGLPPGSRTLRKIHTQAQASRHRRHTP